MRDEETYKVIDLSKTCQWCDHVQITSDYSDGKYRCRRKAVDENGTCKNWESR